MQAWQRLWQIVYMQEYASLQGKLSLKLSLIFKNYLQRIACMSNVMTNCIYMQGLRKPARQIMKIGEEFMKKQLWCWKACLAGVCRLPKTDLWYPQHGWWTCFGSLKTWKSRRILPYADLWYPQHWYSFLCELEINSTTNLEHLKFDDCPRLICDVDTFTFDEEGCTDLLLEGWLWCLTNFIIAKK